VPHAEIKNDTQYHFEPLYLADEDNRPALTAVLKATYVIEPTHSRVVLAEKQDPLCLTGKYWGDPEHTSYQYEPEVAFTKPSTDVALIGHALPMQPGVSRMDVGMQVGSLRQWVTVFGERWLIKSRGLIEITSPRALEPLPLNYEHAFGGRDPRANNPARPEWEPRNPVGQGFRNPLRGFDEPVLLPNIEQRERLFRGYGDTPPPAGFGFLGPHWADRALYAGTYDDTWRNTRMPLLPRDFDRRFLNAASHALIAPNYLLGNEPVAIVNASGYERIGFYLPGAIAPVCDIQLRDGRKQPLSLMLDTVVVNTDVLRLHLIWRGFVILPQGPHDVLAMRVYASSAEALA
jgi:hypothetical protein